MKRPKEDGYEKEKMKFPSFRLSLEIEKTTNLWKVFEERILSLRKVLGITKKEFPRLDHRSSEEKEDLNGALGRETS